MGVKLSWTNRGTVPLDSIKIYRSATKTGTLELVGTTAGNALTYEDNTPTVTNVVYWYSIASVKDGAETLSKRTPIGYFPDTGPGPKNIIIGDWEYGYFGEVTTDMALLPTFDEVASTGGFTRVAADTPTKYRKWVVNGKIIFIPNAVIGTYSVVNMINYKLVKAFGNTASPIMSIDKGDYGFKVRLPTSSPSTDLSGVQTITGMADKLKSELCAQFSTALNWDNTTNANRWFKDGYRLGDENNIYSGSGRIFTGWQDASNVIGLQWSVYTTAAAMATSGTIAGNIIYELDFS
ncbi:hypothetical protein pEaSNUABM37_00129 [Erwinia phage pEa_SNUABM_37]|nr:hypothetical protein pEaSNUABM37_00129 [Erwinia phage pEa_SNUABM_37]QXO10599.1 hypothetical protein pEaSNUABM48_00129 [Erwinia phage pEa_SNUABM_48]